MRPLQPTLFKKWGFKAWPCTQQACTNNQTCINRDACHTKIQISQSKHGGQKLPLQYLEWDVWNALSEQLQASPRTLMQEAQGHIKGGPAPYF